MLHLIIAKRPRRYGQVHARSANRAQRAQAVLVAVVAMTIEVRIHGVIVGTLRLRKNWRSHIDASHSRQPLVNGERLVCYEVNAVMHPCRRRALPLRRCARQRVFPSFPLPPSHGVALSPNLFTLLDLCVPSLRGGHANLLCIVPILTDDPRKKSNAHE